MTINVSIGTHSYNHPLDMVFDNDHLVAGYLIRTPIVAGQLIMVTL